LCLHHSFGGPELGWLNSAFSVNTLSKLRTEATRCSVLEGQY